MVINYIMVNVQATWMKCGGLVVACTFDHLIADAYSANMFLVSWAEMAHPNRPTTSAQPCFRRSLLTPRHPPSIHPSIHQMFSTISDIAPPPEPKPKPEYDPITSRIYYVTSEQISHMQSLATSSAGDQRTKLESFSAFLWKMVGAAAAYAEGKEKVLTKMSVVVEGRKRLSNGDKNKEAIMGCYFGNVVSVPYKGIVAEELVEKPLSWVAEQVHEFLKIAMTKEHFLGLIDWVEVHRPAPAGSGWFPRVCYEGTEEEGPVFLVSSGQRFPGSKVDFGWGKPLFASYYFPMGKGYVMPMPSPRDNGDWLVFMHLPKGHLHFMESKAPLFFKPVSWDYLLDQQN